MLIVIIIIFIKLQYSYLPLSKSFSFSPHYCDSPSLGVWDVLYLFYSYMLHSCYWVFCLVSFGCLFCVYVRRQIHGGSAIVPGACGAPYYCAPLVCVPKFQGGLAVWQPSKSRPK